MRIDDKFSFGEYNGLTPRDLTHNIQGKEKTMYEEERTCVCIKSFIYTFDVLGHVSDKPLEFVEKREYQVDVYPLFFAVYQNGGWNDYVFLTREQFNKYFMLIE